MTWVTRNGRLQCAVHKPNGVRDPRVLGHRSVVVVRLPVGLQHHIFEHAAKADGVPNLRLTFFRKPDAFGVAPAFHVEDPIGRPTMLIISHQSPFWIGRKRGFSGARKAKEQRHIFGIFTVHVA